MHTKNNSLTLASMRQAYNRSRRGKTNRPEVICFSEDLTKNLLALLDDLKNGNYRHSHYRQFTIYEPKKRLILALPFRDRLVHQWLVEEFIKPHFIPRFIYDSYACIPKRGTHAAMRRIQRYMRSATQRYGSDYYVIKLDISRFFYSIDPGILMDIMTKHITDDALIKLIQTIIRSSPDTIGLPIGNYTSQYFANIYLNELDQHLKRTVGIRYYARYMDDFIILVPDKKAARLVFQEVERFLHVRLRLRLNPKSRYFPASHGIDFCGYIIQPNHIKVRKKSKSHIKNIVYDFTAGIDDQARFEARVNAWLGHAQHADTFTYCQKQLADYLHLFPRLKTMALTTTPEQRLTTVYKQGRRQL